MISSVFIESALRSILFALAVWTALRLFAVRNVLAQKVAWGLVLASALTMPALLRMTEHWSVLPASVRVIIPADPETLLGELQARIQANTPSQSASASASPAASPAETDIPDQKTSLAPPPQARLRLLSHSIRSLMKRPNWRRKNSSLTRWTCRRRSTT